MKGLLYLSWRHVCAHPARTLLLGLCIALALWVPWTASELAAHYDADLRSRAAATPLVIGAPGNRYDLTLSALYFRPTELETITYRDFELLSEDGPSLCIPMHLRFTARGAPIVATSIEYAEFRGLRLAEGRDPLRIGEVTLGYELAETLRLGAGDKIYSDPTELYDIAQPPALKMRIAGVYGRTGTADDRALFCDIRTAWVLEGIAHGHVEPDEIDEELVISRTEDSVAVSGALMEYAEVTPENEASFHYHGDTSLLPLSSVIAVPPTVKDGTLLKSGVNARRRALAVTPKAVIADLLGVVFRIKRFFDLVGTFLVLTTGALVALVFLLATRLRTAELRTLDRMGAPRRAAMALVGVEIAGVLGFAVVLALGLTRATLWLLPNLVASF